MKTNKLIGLIFFVIVQVNEIFCQMVTKNERILWNNYSDSITIFHPLFANACFDDDYNTSSYVARYVLPKSEYTIQFSNVTYEDISEKENIFLRQRSVKISDTILYKIHYGENNDSNINIVVAIQPYMLINSMTKKITSYDISFEKKSNSDSFLKRRKTTNPYPDNSVLSQGEWYKIAVNNTGIHKITFNDIKSQNHNTSNIPISGISIYGNGGGALSENNSDFEYNDLIENAIYIEDKNNNGIFDGNDYILFYAQSADIWEFNQSQQIYEYHIHPYSKYNYYYLTINSSATSTKRIKTKNIIKTPADTINTYTYCSTIHNDLVNTHSSGRIWVGEKFTNSVQSRSFSLSIPNAVANSDVNVRYALASISNANSSFDVSINGTTLKHSFTPGYKYPYQGLCRTTKPLSSKCDVTINYYFNESMATGYLDFIEINAISKLSFTNGQLVFRNINMGNNHISQVEINNANTSLRIWNVSNHCDVAELTTLHQGNKTIFIDSITNNEEWIAFDGTMFYTPLSISAIINQDLHGIPQPDYVIVAPSVFTNQAERLAQLHRLHNGLDVAVITPEEIYNEFSSGKQDVMAIRRFLKMLYDRSLENNSFKSPKYLLLFGKAIYDNKNITDVSIPYIVSYQSETSFDKEGSSYTSDDMFGYLGDNEKGTIYESIDVGIGRFPVKNAQEAQTMVDKVEYYLTKKDLSEEHLRGDWRNHITFISDDADPGSPSDIYFITSSENTTQYIKEKYPTLNIEKIYADAYSQQSGAIGSFYPEAKNAITKRINNGCLLLNYVGHGAYQHIGSERYMEITDINSYTNKYQLPFFVASTCSFGKFDLIDEICGAESFVLSPNGGGIAIVAAVRPIGHSEAFDTKVCSYSLDKNNSIGDAFRFAKNETSMTHSMQLLGDPALKLSIPENKIVVTSINNKDISAQHPDTATVLTKITVEGEIRNSADAVINDFDGEILPIVYDRFVTYKTLSNDNDDTEMEFSQQKNILYKGRDSVINGKFKYSFVVPRDVVFQYDYGKLSHYASSETEDAAGSYSNIVFGGFNQNAEIVESRPTIRLFMNDSLFVSGGITDENPSIYAILYDTLGINAVGSGIGHDITAILDNNNNQIMVLNDYYETDIANPDKGYIKYPLYNLSDGVHHLTLKAWNIYNFSSSASIMFKVNNHNVIHIGNFYTYPNPSTSKTTFHLEHNQPSQIKTIEINIYDMKGLLVKRFIPTVVAGSYAIPKIEWDFTTDSGDKISKGIYVAYVIVITDKGERQTAYTKIIHTR